MSILYMGFGWNLDLEPTELLVYLAIADHVDDDGEGCFASYDKLALKTNLTRRTVIRACQKLEETGILVHEGMHPRYGTNVWNINKDKLPLKKPARKKATQDIAIPGRRQKAVDRGDTESPPGVTQSHQGGDTESLGGCHRVTSGGDTESPKPSVEPLVEPSENHPSAAEAADDEFERVPIDDSGEELVDRNPDRPETDLQRKIAQLTHSKYLPASTKAALRNGVTAVWGKNKRPVTYPSPEEEWAAYPDLFAEYVDLCARRIREESTRPPSRKALAESIRNYARYKTGWLDFKQAAQEERRINPPPDERPLYWDPAKPAWMQ